MLTTQITATEREKIMQEIKALMQKVAAERISQVDNAYIYAQKAFDLSEKIGYEQGKAESKVMIASYQYLHKANVEEALKLLSESISFLEQNKVINQVLSWGYVIEGNILWRMGDFEQGFDSMQKSLDIATKNNDAVGLSWISYVLGGLYLEMKDYEKAQKYHIEALKIFEQLQDLEGYATTLSGLGNIEAALEDYQEAIVYYEEALSIIKKSPTPSIEARIYNDLGFAYENLGLYEEALKYYEKSHEIRLKINNILGLITTQNNFGKIYTKLKQYEKAIEYTQMAIKNAQAINAKPRLQKAYQNMAEIYKLLEKPWQALEFYEKYMEIHTLVVGEENEAKHKNLQTKYNLEKTKREAEIHRLKNIELKEANEVIEAQTRNIIDSINYAKRIQEAILPLPSELVKYADTSFVLYQPKDIVSGDCYWFTEQICQEGKKRVIIAAIDCTGHGVPGAFMVVMANSLLNEIVNERKILEPAQILTKLDEKIRNMLHQDNNEIGTQDGMDLTIINVDFDNNDMYFAGAKNSAYLVREGEVKTIKGDPFPIGGTQHKDGKTFTTQYIKMQKGDMYYMATDGFQDQFGGENNTKFTKRRFRELLPTIAHLTPQEQYEKLLEIFLKWKGNFPQTDDVLVMGMKCD
jgi:serine phosphatase RsbU (regulator of sigma subunit)